MRKVPLLAGRCPYCRDEDQGVHGRVGLMLALIIGIFFFASYKEEIFQFVQNKPTKQVIEINSDQEKDGKELLDLLENL
jgi:hypothetical protein